MLEAGGALCPLCRSPLGPLRPQGLDLLYHSCPDCRWIMLDEAHHLSPEKQKERYLWHENSGEDAGYVGMFEDFLQRCVDPFARKEGAALDLGCGPEPVLARLLRRRGFKAYVQDPFFFPDLAGPSKFDLITFTEVLEHLSDPVGILRPWAGRLAPGGILAGMTLFHPDDPKKFSEWWYRRDPTHVSFYTERTLDRLAVGLGLELKFSDGKRAFVLGKMASFESPA